MPLTNESPNPTDGLFARHPEWKGVLWWGVPVATVFAVIVHGRRYGFGWRGLLSVEFLIILSCSVVVIGVLGGRMFGRVLHRVTSPDHDA